MSKRITPTLAKLAKLKGFNDICTHYYNSDEELVEYRKFIDGKYTDVFVSATYVSKNFNDDNITINEDNGDLYFDSDIYSKVTSAPTQDEMISWLNSKDIYCNVYPYEDSSTDEIYFDFGIRRITKQGFLKNIPNVLDKYKTIEDAKNEMIYVCLTLLL